MRRSPLEIFLSQARRQWTVRRIVEHAALGLLFGCAAALPLILVLLSRGADGRSIAIVLPMLGAAAGAMAGFHRRPTALAAAMLADARLGTADLLGTAWMLRSATDPWHSTVIALADAYCRDLSPAILIPRGLSPRACAGVALAAGCVLTLGLMSGTAPLTRAQPIGGSADSDTAINTTSALIVPPSMVQPQLAPSREAKAEQTPDSRPLPGDEEIRSSVNAARKDGVDSPRHSDLTNDGAGNGSARTTNSAGRLPRDSAISLEPARTSGATLSGGSGTTGVQPLLNGKPSFGTVSSPNFSPAPPWSSADWSSDRAAALEAVRSSQIPDTYRELVRDYFDQK